MPRLKAATVSDQIVRKRKRKTRDAEPEPKPTPSATAPSTPPPTTPPADDSIISTPPTITKVPTKTHDGGKKPRRTPRTDGDKPTLKRHGSSTLVESTIPWPDHFVCLAQTHRALNLVYTFCCTRKHLATTFDNLKSTVEGHTKRELTVEDVAQITALIPRAIQFAYVDEAMLQINLMGSEDNINGRKNREQIFEDPAEFNNKLQEHNEVLLFEFIDGDLKRQVTHAKTGEPTKTFQRLRNEDLKMPVFSQKQMMKLIEKRNVKFTSAVNAWLNSCSEEGRDAVTHLLEVSRAYIPAPSQSRDGTPGPESQRVYRKRGDRYQKSSTRSRR
jgi:DEAD/DEAH box helicase domain-containing protein